ncbi:MAG: winged helix DNA-binding domain-containing protein [Chloroflexi bacterium]|nr:winged helix DNA-binding domain-containing protein [Chloroflexota bacterium]
MTRQLELTREQVLAFRRSVQALDERLPAGPASLRRAAWAGLSDSMPRGALLSIHARVEGTTSASWEDPSLAQVWGPRFSAYVVARQDVPVFTLGRHPDSAAGRRRAEDAATRIRDLLDGATMTYSAAGRALGVPPNSLRYATTTGTILIRWDGARRPTIQTIPPPGVTPGAARLELARRFLHVFAVGTPTSFSAWAGVKPASAQHAFDGLRRELVAARTPVGDGWILAADEPAIGAASEAGSRAAAPARLLPSGDTYHLLQGADRALLVPEAERRGRLWTPRVWPGAVLADGEVVGTWRRAGSNVAVEAWQPLTSAVRDAIETEAASLPLPDLRSPIRVRWEP